MGRRNDNFLDDEQAAALFQRLTEQDGHSKLLEPPPDIVSRTLRSLPRVTPHVAARREMRQRMWRRAAGVSAAFLVTLVVVLGVLAATNGSQLALLFGDGRSGISGILLGLALALKPLWNVVRSLNPAVGVVGLVLMVALGWLWWRLFRQTAYDTVAEAYS